MISANQIERDMLLNFMESAQTILPGITLLYAEKYQYDEDIYLRFGLDLPQEINSDSPDVEKVQKIASSLPVSPLYQLSIAFTPACDKEHELALDFLPGKYISSKSKAIEEGPISSSNRLSALWRNLLNRFRRMGFIPLLAFVVLGFLILNSAKDGMKYLDDRDATTKAINAAMADEPAQKKLRSAAREFRSALEEYRDVMYGKSDKLKKQQISDTADHLYDYIKAVEQDPLFEIYGGSQQ